MINTKARAPNNRDKAYKLYKKGMKLVDIANKLEVSESTVRSWKKRCGWDEENATKKRCNVATENKAVPKKKIASDDVIKDTIKNESLTVKQKLFCIYFSKNHNATQSYQKAYDCSYDNACAHAYEMWHNVEVCKEVDRLIEEKAKSVHFEKEELVELMIRIAFADIGNYLTFGRVNVPMWTKDSNGNDIEVIDPNTGEQKIQYYNTVDLSESYNTDTQLIQEIREGKSGVSIKLADRQKAIDWLEKFFAFNPMDRHKIDYDEKKYELEKKRIEHQIEVDERNNF